MPITIKLNRKGVSKAVEEIIKEVAHIPLAVRAIEVGPPEDGITRYEIILLGRLMAEVELIRSDVGSRFELLELLVSQLYRPGKPIAAADQGRGRASMPMSDFAGELVRTLVARSNTGATGFNLLETPKVGRLVTLEHPLDFVNVGNLTEIDMLENPPIHVETPVRAITLSEWGSAEWLDMWAGVDYPRIRFDLMKALPPIEEDITVEAGLAKLGGININILNQIAGPGATTIAGNGNLIKTEAKQVSIQLKGGAPGLEKNAADWEKFLQAVALKEEQTGLKWEDAYFKVKLDYDRNRHRALIRRLKQIQTGQN